VFGSFRTIQLVPPYIYDSNRIFPKKSKLTLKIIKYAFYIPLKGRAYDISLQPAEADKLKLTPPKFT
jgi:hypothetical protein